MGVAAGCGVGQGARAQVAASAPRGEPAAAAASARAPASAPESEPALATATAPALATATATATAPAPAPATATDVELVESAPLETTLDHSDIPNAADVWVAMIARAKTSIDFAEFYASEAEGAWKKTSALAPVIAAIRAACARGVKVRFLADSVFAPKYPRTVRELARAGVEVRVIDFGKRGGGILHAKYFVVDGVESFVGSQNFDWRALAHIQEIGVRVRSRAIGAELTDLFDTDWAFAGGAPDSARARDHAGAAWDWSSHLTLVADPKGWLPDETSWDLPSLVALLDGARSSVDVQVLTYKTAYRDGAPFRVLDEALRRAAARGVHVRLLVSSWNEKPNARAGLDALAGVANVETRVITIPKYSRGDIPFARVSHAKYLVVDGGARAWVGTSNWEGDYFTKTRNVAIVIQGGDAPKAAERVFESGWSSAYARPLSAAPQSPKTRALRPIVNPARAAAAPRGASAPPSSTGPARP
jgi:phosphatidylserine/phosphatidylglycerophosphate/cardiolipin synthase-like enzyme